MDESEAKSWVKNKANQDEVVKRFFRDYPPTKTHMAFFMAGIPGSGKTEFAENTINALNPKLVPIEHDKLVEYIEGYTPENYYNFRTAGSALVSRILKECLTNGYGFIFDGTLSHPKGQKNIKQTLAKGYSVQVIYIVQDALIAWDLTKDRELVKKRAIERNGFVDTCSKINGNLLDVFRSFKEHTGFGFWIFNKNGDLAVGAATPILYNKNSIGTVTEIEEALDFSYNTKHLP